MLGRGSSVSEARRHHKLLREDRPWLGLHLRLVKFKAGRDEKRLDMKGMQTGVAIAKREMRQTLMILGFRW